jgi:predicted ATPase
VGKAAYQVRPELCIAVLVKIVNLCLKHGNTPDCAVGYMAFGSIFLGGVLGNHKTGHEFGKLSLALVDRFGNEHQRPEVNFVIGYFGSSWLRPAPEAEQLWQVTHDVGLRVGDLFHTGCACCATILSWWMRGVPFAEIERQAASHRDFLERAHLREPLGAIRAVSQAMRNLQGLTRERTSFTDSDFDETAFRGQVAGFGSRHFAHYYFVLRMQTLYLWGEYEKALTAADASVAYLGDSPGMLHSAEHHFFHALILAASDAQTRWVRRIFRRSTRFCASRSPPS